MIYEPPSTRLLCIGHASEHPHTPKASNQTAAAGLRTTEQSPQRAHKRIAEDASDISIQVSVSKPTDEERSRNKAVAEPSAKQDAIPDGSEVRRNHRKVRNQVRKRGTELSAASDSKDYKIDLHSTLRLTTHSNPERAKPSMRNGSDKTIWIVSPAVRTSDSEDGTLLLDLTKGLSYKLNVLGSYIWTSIQESSGGTTLQAIVDAVEPRLQVAREQLELDIDDWLGKLNALGLLRKRNSPVAKSD